MMNVRTQYGALKDDRSRRLRLQQAREAVAELSGSEADAGRMISDLAGLQNITTTALLRHWQEIPPTDNTSETRKRRRLLASILKCCTTLAEARAAGFQGLGKVLWSVCDQEDEEDGEPSDGDGVSVSPKKRGRPSLREDVGAIVAPYLTISSRGGVNLRFPVQAEPRA